jgi:hypothetical protein
VSIAMRRCDEYNRLLGLNNPRNYGGQ